MEICGKGQKSGKSQGKPVGELQMIGDMSQKLSGLSHLRQHRHYVIPTKLTYQFQNVFLLLMFFVKTFL